MDKETTSLLKPLLSSDAAAKAESADTPLEPASRLHKAQHALVPVVLDIVPDTILGLLVQNSRDDPGARILTAFTFASIIQSQVVATLQLVLQNSLDARRTQLRDPHTRRELWVLAQAAWLVYMSYLPFAGVICAYTAWLARDAIWGQNADVADVVASLLVINLVSLPFSLGSAMLQTELVAKQRALWPFAVASVVSWTIGLSFAYALGYWTPMGFVGIALTNVLTYGIQFRLLAPATRLLSEWPGWHFREALTHVPRIACHPAMVATLVVNLTMMLFGFTSLLASLIKVGAWIDDAQTNVFPSLLVLSFLPLLGICLLCSMRIKSALAIASGSDGSPVVGPLPLIVGITLLTAAASACWIVGALHQGSSSLPATLVRTLRMALDGLVPAFPPVGFMLTIRPVLRTCVDLWDHASTVFLVAMTIGTGLGTVFAETLDGGIQGLWFGQYLSIVVFVLIAAASIRRWTLDGSSSQAVLAALA